MNSKKRCISYTSSSDEDIPMSVANTLENLIITKKELSSKSVQICDICDKKFFNKYELFIHNTTHIIIPLFRQDFHQCPECDCYCVTKESLENHSYNKHLYIINPSDYNPESLRTVVKYKSCEIDKRDEAKIKHDKDLCILENLVAKQPVTVLVKEPFLISNKTERIPDISGNEQEKNILKDMVTKQAVTVLIKENFFNKGTDKDRNNMAVLIPQSKEDRGVEGGEGRRMVEVKPLISDVIDISDESCGVENVISNEGSFKDEAEEKNPRFRILFEEDNDDYDHDNGNSLLEEINNDLEIEPKSLKENINVANSNRQNTIILGRYPVGIKTKSVHYDNLIEDIVHKCRRCLKSFENRYKLIIHETSHLKFKRRLPFLCRICDWYVAADPWALRFHQQRKHPDQVVPKSWNKSCQKCHLRYQSLQKHEKNYHSTGAEYEPIAADETIYNKSDDSVTEKAESWHSKSVNVCDLCYLFFKSRGNIRYKFLSDVNRTGDRMQCERCNKMFFELKQVQFEMKRIKKKDICERKTISNKERLKIVQQRLKKLKLLNKF